MLRKTKNYSASSNVFNFYWNYLLLFMLVKCWTLNVYHLVLCFNSDCAFGANCAMHYSHKKGNWVSFGDHSHVQNNKNNDFFCWMLTILWFFLIKIAMTNVLENISSCKSNPCYVIVCCSCRLQLHFCINYSPRKS